MEEFGIKLLAGSEKQEFIVSLQIATQSKVLQKIIEDNGIEESIPLPKIKPQVLKKIIEYCEIHINSPFPKIQFPFKSKEIKDLVEPLDCKFIEAENLTDLCEMIAGANQLDIDGLVDLASLQVAKLMATKKPNEIKQSFGIEEEFTKEEIDEVIKENPWLKEEESSDENN